MVSRKEIGQCSASLVTLSRAMTGLGHQVGSARHEKKHMKDSCRVPLMVSRSFFIGQFAFHREAKNHLGCCCCYNSLYFHVRLCDSYKSSSVDVRTEGDHFKNGTGVYFLVGSCGRLTEAMTKKKNLKFSEY